MRCSPAAELRLATPATMLLDLRFSGRVSLGSGEPGGWRVRLRCEPVGAARGHGPVPRGGRTVAPPRTAREAGRGRGRRRPDQARRRLHRFLRGAGVRRALRPAAAHRREALPRLRVPAGGRRRLQRGLGAGHGRAARDRLPGRGARLGRGVRRRGRPKTRRASPAAWPPTSRRPRSWTARSASATTSCRPRSRPASASRPASPGSRPRPGSMSSATGRRTRSGGSARRPWPSSPRSASPRSASSPPPTRPASPGSSAPTTGPWLVLLGNGRGESEVDPTPYVPRSHGREVTYQRNLADWAEVAAEIARLARQVAAEVTDRPVARVVVKVRYAPFDTITHGTSAAPWRAMAAGRPTRLPAGNCPSPARRAPAGPGMTASGGPPCSSGPPWRPWPCSRPAAPSASSASGRSSPTTPIYSVRLILISGRVGSEGSGWRSPVGLNPHRS